MRFPKGPGPPGFPKGPGPLGFPGMGFPKRPGPMGFPRGSRPLQRGQLPWVPKGVSSRGVPKEARAPRLPKGAQAHGVPKGAWAPADPKGARAPGQAGLVWLARPARQASLTPKINSTPCQSWGGDGPVYRAGPKGQFTQGPVE